MNREEAIKHLETYSTTLGSGQTTQAQHEEAKRIAIKALEQEPCCDAISRQAIIDMTGLSEWFDSSDSYNEFVIALSELPPVNPQPKTGHWIRMKAYGKWACSECCTVFRFTFKEHDYCPNCGAKMEVEK